MDNQNDKAQTQQRNTVTPNTAQQLFRSSDIQNTLARENVNKFVNVKEKKTAKQVIGSFQKKLVSTKKPEKAQQPPKPKKNIPWKRIVVIMTILGVLAIAGVIFLPGLIQKYSITEDNALFLLEDNQKLGIWYFEQLAKGKSDEAKSRLYLDLALGLEKTCAPECKDDMIEYAEKAEELFPTFSTAYVLETFERTYGDETNAEKWNEIKTTRTTEGEIW